MACDRCGREPEADMLRFATMEGDHEETMLLCPECGYGLRTLMSAYVANALEPPRFP
jgi:DNA-directed RNA polymerase subunit RPC12/RpoP